MGGAEQTEPDDGAGKGAARSWSNSEGVTRRGVKQKIEAEPSSIVAEFNHVLKGKREPATGLPNLYVLSNRSLWGRTTCGHFPGPTPPGGRHADGRPNQSINVN